jgi:hypothetical protein
MSAPSTVDIFVNNSLSISAIETFAWSKTYFKLVFVAFC